MNRQTKVGTNKQVEKMIREMKDSREKYLPWALDLCRRFPAEEFFYQRSVSDLIGELGLQHEEGNSLFYSCPFDVTSPDLFDVCGNLQPRWDSEVELLSGGYIPYQNCGYDFSGLAFVGHLLYRGKCYSFQVLCCDLVPEALYDEPGDVDALLEAKRHEEASINRLNEKAGLEFFKIP